MQLLVNFLLFLSFLHSVGFAQDLECERQLISRVTSNGEFSSWQSVLTNLPSTPQTNLVVRMPVDGLSISLNSLNSLPLPTHTGVHPVNDLNILSNGYLYLVLNGFRSQLVEAIPWLEERFAHAPLSYRILESHTQPAEAAKDEKSSRLKILLPLFNWLREEVPELPWSKPSQLPIYFEKLVRAAVPEARVTATLAALEGIQFRTMDQLNARIPGAAQTRFLQAVKLLMTPIDPSLAQAEADVDWSNRVIRSYRLAKAKKIAEIANPIANAPSAAILPKIIYPIRLSEWTTQRRYQNLRLEPTRPLALVTFHGTPAWTATTGEIFRATAPELMIEMIEALSKSKLSMKVRQQIHQLHARPESLPVETWSQMTGSYGSMRMFEWAKFQELRVLVPPTQIKLSASDQNQLVIIPLNTIESSRSEPTEPQSTISSNTQSVVHMRDEATAPAAAQQPLPIFDHSVEIANGLEITFAPYLRANFLIKDSEDLRDYIFSYGDLAIPHSEQPGKYWLIYFDLNDQYRVHLTFHWQLSQDGRKYDKLVITSLREANVPEEKFFWGHMSRGLNLESKVYELSMRQYVMMDSQRLQRIHVSGAVLTKINLKHGISEEKVFQILSQIRILRKTQRGAWVSNVQIGKRTYAVYLGIEGNEVRLMTLYAP